MTPENSYAWIAVRLHLGPNAVWVDYEASRGARRRSQVTPPAESPGWIKLHVSPPVPWRLRFPPPPYVHNIRVPKDFAVLVNSLLENLPLNQTGPHANGPVPLAVFFEAPPGTEDLADYWLLVISSLMRAHVPPERFQLARLPRHKRRGRRAPFSLPLRVLAVTRECDAALDSLRDAWWYAHTPEVQQHGIVMVPGTVSSLGGGPQD